MYFKERKILKKVVAGTDSFIKKNYVKEYEGTFYRTHSFLELLNLLHTRNQLKRNEKIFIADETLLSIYEGHSFFSIFMFNAEVFDQIIRQLSWRKFEESLDSRNDTTEAIFLRRLYRVLSLPVYQNDLVLNDESCMELQEFWSKKLNKKIADYNKLESEEKDSNN